MNFAICIMADTTVCSSDTPTKSNESKASIRKSNKPLMEKRRRARINTCLGQLKSLVLQALKKDTSQFSKLEKADILEMTVKHLKGVQQQQMSVAMATDPNVLTKYRAGFNECAGEVMRYLGSVNELTDDMRTRVLNHLAMCMQSVNTAASVSLATQAAAANQATLASQMNSGHCGIPASFFPAFPQPQTAHVLTQATPTSSTASGLSSMAGITPRIPQPEAKPAMSCSSSLQLIPGTLPSGQLAFFVASPATIHTPIQAIPVYTAPSSGSTSPMSSPEISPKPSVTESSSPVTSTSNLGSVVIEKSEESESCAESSFSASKPRVVESVPVILPTERDSFTFGAVQNGLAQLSSPSNTPRDAPRITSPSRRNTDMELPHAHLEQNDDEDKDVWRPW